MTARRLVNASLSDNTRRAHAVALSPLDAWIDGRRPVVEGDCTVNTMRLALSPLTKAAQVERDSGFDQQRAALEELTAALEAAIALSGPARRAPESRD